MEMSVRSAQPPSSLIYPNDCLGVMKSIMGELTDPTNRAQGYALLPAVKCIGSTIGFVAKQFYVISCFFFD